MSLSPAQRLLELPRTERKELLARMTEQEVERLRRDWRFWARPEQLQPPGEWTLWALVTGRGFGKTRSGAEFILDRSETFATYGAPHRFGMIGRTAADVRDVMIEGESGLEECCSRRGYRFHYEPSKRRVTIPELESMGTSFTAEKPDQTRGHQWHTLWADEPAAWKLLVDREGNSAWSNAMLALRLEGTPPASWFEDIDDDELPDFTPAPPELQPRACATTTPKPIPLVRDWVKRATANDSSIHLTTGSLFDNVANLAPRFVAEVAARYVGTRLAAQEIAGLLLDHVEGALWTPEMIEVDRLMSWAAALQKVGRIVVAVDPSGSTKGDHCGIVVVGVEAEPVDPLRRHVFILEDLSVQDRPEVWAKVAVDAYHRWGANCIVAEVNFGAALVADVIHLTDANVAFDEVRASRGKRVRAEPVSALYAQHRAHHIGYMGDLEAEMCTWVPDDDDSPDRMDAMVWGVSYLLPEITSPPASQTDFAHRQLPTGAGAAMRGGSGAGSPFGFSNEAGLWLPLAA